MCAAEGAGVEAMPGGIAAGDPHHQCRGYSANVVFLNLVTGAAQRREFNLLVGNPGFENGDLSNWSVNADKQVNFANSTGS